MEEQAMFHLKALMRKQHQDASSSFSREVKETLI
jgi:hypothetical protein